MESSFRSDLRNINTQQASCTGPRKLGQLRARSTDYPEPKYSRSGKFKDTLNSILSSLHKIIDGILQKKGVLVKAAYFQSTGLPPGSKYVDWIIILKQRNLHATSDGKMSILKQPKIVLPDCGKLGGVTRVAH